MTKTCDKCKQDKETTAAAVVSGVYYRTICSSCLSEYSNSFTSSGATYDRNRQYEDFAQDTIQPYIGDKPNPEFLRLYPDKAPKIFRKDELDEIKRKI